METIAALAAKKLGKFLANDFRDIFGSAHNEAAEQLGALARSTIECIAQSDALYHNFEHTMLVTVVGRESTDTTPNTRRYQVFQVTE